jgi:hypothetical protein
VLGREKEWEEGNDALRQMWLSGDRDPRKKAERKDKAHAQHSGSGSGQGLSVRLERLETRDVVKHPRGNRAALSLSKSPELGIKIR